MSDPIDLQVTAEELEFEPLEAAVAAANCFSSIASASTLSCPSSSAYCMSSASCGS